jgi:AraC family transcriptional regulator
MTDTGSPGRQYLLEEYRSRINRVIDHIEANIDRDMPLSELADVAHFSPFHFHRIFRAMVGETLNVFIQRVRLEKAAAKLVANPRRSITGIAMESGFSSPSVFARSFKEAFGMSASAWRSGGWRCGKGGKAESKENQASGKIRQDFDIYPSYIDNKQLWRVEMKDGKLKAKVEVREMPEMTVAYIRHIGPYKGDQELFGSLFNRLMAWAGPRGLLRFPETKIMSVYYDDPEVTDESRLRVDACITVPANTKVDGEIGKTVIPAGKYAIAHFEINLNQYQDAWDAVFRGWLPGSGYQPADGPCYELCYNSPEEYPEGKEVVDICVPVKPL